MRSDGLRIIKFAAPMVTYSSHHDNIHSYMTGYTLNLMRKTAALIWQSQRSADEDNPESRLRQKGLVNIAVEIRGDHDPLEECAKRGVILIVAGRRCYDFCVSDDLNAFIRKMQEAYGYIDTHVRYMLEMRQQKLARGEWVGGSLVAPYALDRATLAAARELRKTMKELGASEEDELLITKAYRLVIYEPWRGFAINLFEPFKLFNYSRSFIVSYDKMIFHPPMPITEAQRIHSIELQAGAMTEMEQAKEALHHKEQTDEKTQEIRTAR